MTEIKEFTMQDVAKHNTKNDLYLVVHEKVYDCTRFLDEHPYVYFRDFVPAITLMVAC